MQWDRSPKRGSADYIFQSRPTFMRTNWGHMGTSKDIVTCQSASYPQHNHSRAKHIGPCGVSWFTDSHLGQTKYLCLNTTSLMILMVDPVPDSVSGHKVLTPSSPQTPSFTQTPTDANFWFHRFSTAPQMPELLPFLRAVLLESLLGLSDFCCQPWKGSELITVARHL